MDNEDLFTTEVQYEMDKVTESITRSRKRKQCLGIGNEEDLVKIEVTTSISGRKPRRQSEGMMVHYLFFYLCQPMFD